LISNIRRLPAQAGRAHKHSGFAPVSEHAQKLIFVCVLGAVAMIAGCSSSNKQAIQVGSITFTDANGKQLSNNVTSINAGGTIYADAQLANDIQLLGVDWTVTCGSAPPPGSPLPPGVVQDDTCGIFSPVHTASAPVPSYASSGAGVVTLFTAPANPPKGGIVTLFAAATADHSRYSTVTLTIQGSPISIQFGSVPVTTLPVNGTTTLKAVLTNDYVAGGANWTATCGGSACGSFSPSKTSSGQATTYTAPASVPSGGTVVIAATSVTDPTKSISTVVTIEPITVSVAAESPTVGAGGTDLVSATVANDVSNSGVDWTLSCSTSDCGTIDAHTASGTAATYTAPVTIPGSGEVTIRATSTADTSAYGKTSVTVDNSSALSGTVLSGGEPVRGAALSLYAAGKQGYGSSSIPIEIPDRSSQSTDANGRFNIAQPIACPSRESQIYLVSHGGNAGGGENPNLAFVRWLGSCGDARNKHGIVMNEATTVAFAFAFAHLASDERHVGAPSEKAPELLTAGSLTDDLVDAAGRAREHSPRANGLVSYRRINGLANVLHHCDATAGGHGSDGSPCGRLFSLTGGDAIQDTLQAALEIAHRSSDADLSASIFALGADDGLFAPAEPTRPENWMLSIRYPVSSSGVLPAAFANSGSWIDPSGNEWVQGTDGRVIEYIGTRPSEKTNLITGNSHDRGTQDR
jgi:hypothetical protein